MKALNWGGTPLLRPSICYHMIGPYLYNDIKPAVIEARPAGLKIVADNQEFALFSDYYNALKDYTLFFARAYTPAMVIASAWNSGTDPVQAAYAYHNSILPLTGYLPGAYWGSWNEPPVGCESWLDVVDATRVELAAQHGYRVTCQEWSEGTPRVPPWDATNSYALAPQTLAAINQYGPNVALLGPHEYCRAQDGGFLTQPWRIGRINDALAWMEAQGYTNVYVALTEYGRDNPPWKDMGLPASTYAGELIDEAVHDFYHSKVLCRETFTLDYAPGWGQHDIYGECFAIVNSYLVANRPSYVPPFPGTPDPPDPPDPVGEMVTIANLYLRAGPGTQYNKKLIMPLGTHVEVVGTEGNWAAVEVTLPAWLLSYAVPESTYTTWDKEYPFVTGWCSLSYLQQV